MSCFWHSEVLRPEQSFVLPLADGDRIVEPDLNLLKAFTHVLDHDSLRKLVTGESTLLLGGVEHFSKLLWLVFRDVAQIFVVVGHFRQLVKGVETELEQCSWLYYLDARHLAILLGCPE